MFEPRLGRFLSKDLTGVPVAGKRRYPERDAVWVDEVDEAASPTRGKGIGEIGVVGVAPAVANAVFHATELRNPRGSHPATKAFGGKLTTSHGRIR